MTASSKEVSVAFVRRKVYYQLEILRVFISGNETSDEVCLAAKSRTAAIHPQDPF